MRTIKTTLAAALLALSLGSTTAVSHADSAGSPAANVGAQADAPKKVTYPKGGLQIRRLSGKEAKLTGTPASLKRFVRKRLDTLYREDGSKPRCAKAPTVVISRYHSDGFARAAEGIYAPCASGGYAITYIRANGAWKPVLGTQDVLPCADFAWFGIPKFIAGNTCLSEDYEPIKYRPGTQERSSGKASARRLSNITFRNGIPLAGFATSTAAKKARQLTRKGAYLEATECVTGGDGSEAGKHLAAGQEGCLIRASYDDNTYAVLHVVPMVVNAAGDHIGQDLIAIANS